MRSQSTTSDSSPEAVNIKQPLRNSRSLSADTSPPVTRSTDTTQPTQITDTPGIRRAMRLRGQYKPGQYKETQSRKPKH